MNERFARRRGAAVLSFSFPLALRSADRSAKPSRVTHVDSGETKTVAISAPCCFASSTRRSTSTRAGLGTAMRWIAGDCAYRADAHRLPSEHPDEVVPLRAGQHLGPFDERIAAPMASAPRQSSGAPHRRSRTLGA
jgi:hypothetical protein